MSAEVDEIIFKEIVECPKCEFEGRTIYTWEFWEYFPELFMAHATVFNDLIMRSYKCPACDTIHITRSRVLTELQGKVLE